MIQRTPDFKPGNVLYATEAILGNEKCFRINFANCEIFVFYALSPVSYTHLNYVSFYYPLVSSSTSLRDDKNIHYLKKKKNGNNTNLKLDSNCSINKYFR